MGNRANKSASEARRAGVGEREGVTEPGDMFNPQLPAQLEFLANLFLPISH